MKTTQLNTFAGGYIGEETKVKPMALNSEFTDEPEPDNDESGGCDCKKPVKPMAYNSES